MEYNFHQSVLLNESIQILDIKPDGIYVDATLGRGGHSSVILQHLTNGHLYCFDKDSQAIQYCQNKFQNENKVTLINNDFASLKEELNHKGINHIQGILYDLGVSSPQFDDPKRGFSYRFDTRLDMRMNQNQDFDAYQLVNTYSLQQLNEVFRLYGEEKYSYQIAKTIVNTREKAPIETTFQLVDIIKSVLPSKVLNSKGHPAKKVFQAIRIEVNHELDVLKDSLQQALDLLDVNGICAVITFQSLEDRYVKQKFKEICQDKTLPADIPVVNNIIESANFQMLTRHGIVADSDELENNNRAHSARLRAVRKIRL